MGGSQSKSELRVFFSADLVGSTKLKNRLNHQELLEKYRSRRHVVEKLQAQGLQISGDAERTAVLQSLGVSTDDFDWATVVYNFYQGIHSEFVSNLQSVKPIENSPLSLQLASEIKPWKAVGDELIYEIKVASRRELHEVTIAFLKSIRAMDQKVRGNTQDINSALRIKGAAWVAGFPVRNREIQLPPDGRPDFLGPDMDSGFRVAKCTRSGMLVVSTELAELLGECQAEFAPMLGKIVGWEVMKGVWNDLRYPVIWVDFPDPHPAVETHSAIPFTLWDQEECRWCQTWSDATAKTQLSSLAKTLRDIRIKLPRSLGIVDPYILGDPLETEQVPSEHKQILELIDMIELHREPTLRQVADETDRGDTTLENEVADIEQLIQQHELPNSEVDK